MRHFKTEFIESNGHSISGKDVVGFLHICRKPILQYCFCCMKDIIRNEKYIDFYSQVYGKERAHLDCYIADHQEGIYLAVKKAVWKSTWIVEKFPKYIEIN